MAIPAMPLLQQHDAQRDILIEPAARRRAAIDWAQSGRKNQLACSISLPTAFIHFAPFQCYECYQILLTYLITQLPLVLI